MWDRCVPMFFCLYCLQIFLSRICLHWSRGSISLLEGYQQLRGFAVLCLFFALLWIQSVCRGWESEKTGRGFVIAVFFFFIHASTLVYLISWFRLKAIHKTWIRIWGHIFFSICSWMLCWSIKNPKPKLSKRLSEIA